MGMMIDGQWQRDDLRSAGANFVRPQTVFRNWVTADGRPGPSGEGGFKAERGRYHLYVSLACPWAHRTLIVRKLKKLDDAITVSVVDPFMGDDGWAFSAPDGSLTPGATRDDLNGARYLHEIYTKARRDYTGPRHGAGVMGPRDRDHRQQRVVRDNPDVQFGIQRARRRGRRPLSAGAARGDRRTQRRHLRHRQQRRLQVRLRQIAGGLRGGFRPAVRDARPARAAPGAPALSLRRRARPRPTGGCSPRWCVSTRVYYSHFKCNLRRIIDYSNLWGYTRDLYQVPGVAETVSLAHIKRHYYASHAMINPTRIVPKGPAIDFATPQDRARLAS